MQKESRADNSEEQQCTVRSLLSQPRKTRETSVAHQYDDEYPINNGKTVRMREGSYPDSFTVSSVIEKGSVTVREAGKRGGLSCLRKQRRGFFIEIGRKGQSVTRTRYPNMAREWGRLGGRPRKLQLNEIVGEKSKYE